MKANTSDVKPVRQVRSNKNSFYYLIENEKLKMENILISFADMYFKIFNLKFSKVV